MMPLSVRSVQGGPSVTFYLFLHVKNSGYITHIGVKRSLRAMSYVSIGSQLFSHASTQEVAPPLLSRPEDPLWRSMREKL